MKMRRPRGFVRCAGALGLAVLVLPLVLAGCGSSKGTVSGTITCNGEPLGNGQVMFINQKDPTKALSAPIQADGTYTIANMATGPATITVETFPTPGGGAAGGQPGSDTIKGGGKMDVMPKAPGSAGKYVKIPEKYKSKDKSDLTYDVKAGRQKKDFDLSK